MDEKEAFAPFWGHLEELRRTLLRILLIIVAAVLLCFICYEPLIAFLKIPLTTTETKPFHEEHLNYVRVHNPGPNAKIIELPGKSLLSNDLSTKILPLTGNSYEIAPGGSIVYAKT